MPRTVARARSDFFLKSGFAPDGGYDEPWSEALFAGLPYRVRNGPLRRAALRIHDLHHLVTGYDTDWRGEAEISAWELGSGGAGRHLYAWNIALWGLFTGLVAAPERTWRAFRRGRQRTNLYVRDVDVDALLPSPETELQLLTAEAPPRIPAGPAFAAFALLAMAWGALATLVVPAFALRAGLRAHCACACPSVASG